MKIKVFMTLALASSVSALGQASHTRATLLADRETIEPDVPFHLGLKLEMDKHWHTYWENPGSSGLPTQVTWDEVDGLKLGPLRYPAPKKFVDSAGFVTYGFEDEVVLIIDAVYTGSADQIALRGQVTWLECKNVCLPGKANIKLDLKVGKGARAETSFTSYLSRLPKNASESDVLRVTSKIDFAPSQWRGQIRLAPKGEARWSDDMSQVSFFPGPTEIAELTSADAKRDGQTLVIDVTYEVFDSQGKPNPVIWGVVKAKLGDRWSAYRVRLHPPAQQASVRQATPTDAQVVSDRPATAGQDTLGWRELADDFSISSRTSGYQGTDAFLGFLSGEEQGSFQGKSLWLIMLLVLLGGLALNLTPCVLPLIPINLSIIGAGAQAGSRSRGFALGGMYGLGICLVYGALGLVVILGLSNAFGALNAKAWFNAGIAVIFIVLALAMFDVIAIDFTRYQNKIESGQKTAGGFFLPFTMGSVSALLAGACVAPVVISTIVYAQDQFTKGVVLALALPFLLGLGMALPWPFAGAGLSFLPKPGKWMVRVKQGFGVFILAFALYYGYLAYTLARPQPTAHDENGVWTHSLVQGLNLARQEGKPVMIDFWATWCKNCLTMDKTTFRDQQVIDALQEFVPIKVQAEDLDEPRTAEILEYFGAKGLPTYVLLTPRTD